MAIFCLTVVSPPPPPPAILAVRFRAPVWIGAFEGSYPVSGTYAHPGADIEVEFGTTSMEGILVKALTTDRFAELALSSAEQFHV